ncbi:hypothetical protein QQ045_015023 [Rhodiola kirilowii]
MDVWAWICELPMSDEWSEEHSFTLELAREHSCSITLKADRTQGSNSEALVTFYIYLSGFDTINSQKSIWVSDGCPLTEKQGQFLPLVLQLLLETVSRSPGGQGNTLCPRSNLQKLKPDPIIWLMDSHSPESFSTFFNLIFITRLFWLCVSDSPVDVGSLYFYKILSPNIELVSSFHQAPVLKKFLISVGVDVELCFMRTLGYILAKWLILKEVNGLVKSPNLSGFSYATESHGFWTLKGYAPIGSMRLTSSSDLKAKSLVHSFDPTEAALRYALAHQHLEAVIQLEYSVTFLDNFIQVNARVDNIRIHMTKLGFTKYDNDSEFSQERHFPSRIRVWVGPEVGASYVAGLSLSKSTENAVTETECRKTLKGSFGSTKVVPTVKSTSRTSTRTKTKAWRWDQEAEGNAAVFDAVLCDPATGLDVASGGGGGGMGLRKRYSGASRAFSKTGGLVLAGDEYGDGVVWRVGKEMEGSVLTWRIGGEILVSYCASEVKSGYWECRSVEWCDEVDLPLISTKTVV